jgi:3-methyladenine DNA glycosylase/8-oxoguanine DNA glycosylase
MFSDEDVGIHNRLQAWQRLGKPLDYGGVHWVVREWSRYAGRIYLHLWLKRLAEKRLLST